MIVTENWAIVRFEGGTMIGGRCHTDVLGFGPSSSPEEASGEKFCFDFSSYIYTTCVRVAALTLK